MILSPLIIARMTKKDIESVAAVSPETTQQRAHSESRKLMLQKGLETFRDAMSGLKR